MSSEGILSSSVTGKNECELYEKSFTHRKYLQFLNDIQKHENKDQAFIEFS